MMAKNLARVEFIGRSVKIVNSPNSSLVGLEGKIVDETMKTFKILVNGEIKTVFKKGALFALNIDSKNTLLNGNDIIIRPEDRLKI